MWVARQLAKPIRVEISQRAARNKQPPGHQQKQRHKLHAFSKKRFGMHAPPRDVAGAKLPDLQRVYSKKFSN
jgi:hypothetical protein